MSTPSVSRLPLAVTLLDDKVFIPISPLEKDEIDSFYNLAFYCLLFFQWFLKGPNFCEISLQIENVNNVYEIKLNLVAQPAPVFFKKMLKLDQLNCQRTS